MPQEAFKLFLRKFTPLSIWLSCGREVVRRRYVVYMLMLGVGWVFSLFLSISFTHTDVMSGQNKQWDTIHQFNLVSLVSSPLH